MSEMVASSSYAEDHAAFKLALPRVFLGYPTYDGDSARYATFPFKAAWSSAYVG
jgi:hypothetical protein